MNLAKLSKKELKKLQRSCGHTDQTVMPDKHRNFVELCRNCGFVTGPFIREAVMTLIGCSAIGPMIKGAYVQRESKKGMHYWILRFEGLSDGERLMLESWPTKYGFRVFKAGLRQGFDASLPAQTVEVFIHRAGESAEIGMRNQYGGIREPL